MLRSLWRLGFLVALVVGMAACGSPTPVKSGRSPSSAAPLTFTVSGEILVQFDSAALEQDPNRKVGGPCVADSGFDDIRDGGDVIVTDPSGKTIGLGNLEPGQLTQDTKDSLTGWCGYSFALNDVPTGFHFYGIKVGKRDVKQFTFADVSQPIVLQLGHAQSATSNE